MARRWKVLGALFVLLFSLIAYRWSISRAQNGTPASFESQFKVESTRFISK